LLNTLLEVVGGVAGSLAIGAGGNVLYRWATLAWQSSLRGLKGLKPDENGDIELAVGLSALQATFFCVQKALTLENIKPIRPRLKAIRRQVRRRIAHLEKDFHPFGIDHRQLLSVKHNEEYGSQICMQEVKNLESTYGELTEDVRKIFQDDWFELLVKQYLYQIKNDARVERAVLVKEIDDLKHEIGGTLERVEYPDSPIYRPTGAEIISYGKKIATFVLLIVLGAAYGFALEHITHGSELSSWNIAGVTALEFLLAGAITGLAVKSKKLVYSATTPYAAWVAVTFLAIQAGVFIDLRSELMAAAREQITSGHVFQILPSMRGAVTAAIVSQPKGAVETPPEKLPHITRRPAPLMGDSIPAGSGQPPIGLGVTPNTEPGATPRQLPEASTGTQPAVPARLVAEQSSGAAQPFATASTTPSQDAATKVGADMDTSIEVFSKPPISYTDEARQLKVQGDVVLRVKFCRDGHVQVLEVVHGLGHGLDEEARRVAEQIRFRPATRNGQAVDSTTTITITFQLA
jgi:TonB family protein